MCVGIQILSDDVFEQDETFSGRITGILLPGGTLESNVPGVTVDRRETVVTITDGDGTL